MASGYGSDGGPTRCFPFWQDFLSCYVINTTGRDEGAADTRWKCLPQRNDYYECLHHRKEAAKVTQVKAAYIRHLKETEGAPEKGGAGGARSLGVLK